MIKHLVTAITLASTALSILNVRADDTANHLYSGDDLFVAVDMGGLFQQDMDFVEHTAGGLTLKGKAGFDPGIRFGIDAGKKLNDSLTAELETGVLWNSIDTLNGFHLSQVNESIDQYEIPLLAKLIYHFHNSSKFTPYFGIGVGGVLNIVDFKGFAGRTTDTDIQFAYQAEGGLTYALSDRMSIALAYKFLGSLDQSYKYFTETIDFNGVYSHSVLLSFNWKL